MPSDQARWNQRYLTDDGPPALPREWLMEHQSLLPAAGLALDAAMGLGGSAAWLLERGWRVVGADISEVAARRAKARWPALLALVADLENFPLPEQTFDLILDFFYLERALWPRFRRALKPGGLLLMETFLRSPRGDEAGMNPAYLLEPGELRAAFSDWQVLDYREGQRGGRRVAAIAATSRLTLA